MKAIAARCAVRGQKNEGETRHRPTGRWRTPALVVLVATAAFAMTAGGCARPGPQPETQSPAGQAQGTGPQSQPGPPGAGGTPLGNTTPLERQAQGGATGATGADWLTALGALFAPFITPGAPGSFLGNIGRGQGEPEERPGQQADNAPSGPNLVYPPPEPNLVYPPPPSPGPPSPPVIAENAAPPAPTPEMPGNAIVQ